jgi:hypothetical protein
MSGVPDEADGTPNRTAAARFDRVAPHMESLSKIDAADAQPCFCRTSTSSTESVFGHGVELVFAPAFWQAFSFVLLASRVSNSNIHAHTSHTFSFSTKCDGSIDSLRTCRSKMATKWLALVTVDVLERIYRLAIDVEI